MVWYEEAKIGSSQRQPYWSYSDSNTIHFYSIFKNMLQVPFRVDYPKL